MRKLIATQADWNGAILVHSDLSEAQLRWSRLVEVNAVCGRFAGENLVEADLSDGQFMGASCIGEDLSGANLTIAKFAGADFSDADLSGAHTCFEGKAAYVDSVQKLRELESSERPIKVNASTKFGLNRPGFRGGCLV